MKTTLVSMLYMYAILLSLVKSEISYDEADELLEKTISGLICYSTCTVIILLHWPKWKMEIHVVDSNLL